MKKYLIIGGAGFIGSHLSEALLKQSNRVVVIDTMPFEFTGVKAYKIDIRDYKKIGGVFKKERPDVVFHLAGAINLRREITDPLFLKDVDFLSRTKIILDVCKKYNVKKIIFISSGGAIYENAQKIPTAEGYEAHPASLYGLANLLTEKYIVLYCQRHGVGFSIPRLSNAYGPRQWQSGFIPSVIAKLLKKEKPVMYGAGNQTRDFVYIDDAIEALILLAQKGKNSIYNVGSGKETSLKEVLGLIKKYLGSKSKLSYENARGPETQRSALDIKKIKKELGWIPKTSMEQGVAKTIDWFRAHGRY